MLLSGMTTSALASGGFVTGDLSSPPEVRWVVSSPPLPAYPPACQPCAPAAPATTYMPVAPAAPGDDLHARGPRRAAGCRTPNDAGLASGGRRSRHQGGSRHDVCPGRAGDGLPAGDGLLACYGLCPRRGAARRGAGGRGPRRSSPTGRGSQHGLCAGSAGPQLLQSGSALGRAASDQAEQDQTCSPRVAVVSRLIRSLSRRSLKRRAFLRVGLSRPLSLEEPLVSTHFETETNHSLQARRPARAAR